MLSAGRLRALSWFLMATVALYLDIYNLFVSLLHLLGAMNDD